MLTQLRFSMLPLAAVTATELDRLVEQTKQNLSKDPPTRSANFGQRLKEAVKRKVSGYSLQAKVSAEDESFGQKVKQAAQRHPQSQESHRKNVEKERARQEKERSHYKPRKPTKSD